MENVIFVVLFFLGRAWYGSLVSLRTQSENTTMRIKKGRSWGGGGGGVPKQL